MKNSKTDGKNSPKANVKQNLETSKEKSKNNKVDPKDLKRDALPSPKNLKDSPKKKLDPIKKGSNADLVTIKNTSNRSNSGHKKNLNSQNTLATSINGHIEKAPKQMTEKRAQKILKNGGMIDAYKCIFIFNLDLMESLCKNGLPSGDIYEYAAYTITNYEKKWKLSRAKEVKEKIKQYKMEKKEREAAEKLQKEHDHLESIERRLNRSMDHGKKKKGVEDLKRSMSAKKVKNSNRSPSPNQSFKDDKSIRNNIKTIKGDTSPKNSKDNPNLKSTIKSNKNSPPTSPSKYSS